MTGITTKSQTKTEGKSNLSLFLNIFPAGVASQAVFMSVSLVNTLMAAKVSTAAMAAIGLVGSIIWSFNSLGIGVMSTILSRMGYVLGEKKYQQVGEYHRQAYWVILFMSCLIIAIDLVFAFNLELFGISPEMLEIAIPFFFISLFNIPLFLLLIHLRNLNAAIAYTLPTLISSLFGLTLVIPLNFYFMYGELPILGHNPGYAAFSITITNFIYILIIFIMIKFKPKHYAHLQLFKPFFSKPNFTLLKDTLKIGLPISLQYWLENSFYALVAVIIAHLGTSVVAAHEASMTTYGMAYVFAMSGSITINSIVARRLGERNRQSANNFIKSMSSFIIAYNIIIGIFIYFFRLEIANIYITNDDTALHITQILLVILAISNIFDSIYAGLLGYLIPFRDSRYTFLVTIIVSWGIGLPIASIFAFTDWFFGYGNYGVYAYWVAFIFVSFTDSLLFILRIILKWNKVSDQELYAYLDKHENSEKVKE